MKKIRLKEVITNKTLKTGPFGSDLKISDYIEFGDYKVFTQENVINNNFFIGNKYISLEKYQKLFSCKLKINEICVSTRGTLGVFSQNKNPTAGIIHSSVIKFNLSNKVNSKFLLYQLNFSNNVKEYLNEITFSSAVPAIYSSDIKNIPVFYTDINEQTAIANYLDHHTAKIDSEIDYLEKKSILLEEYKQSLIYEIVTKGLDKNVSMKDSGIEWIGMIPAHWEVKRVKDVAKWQTGFTPDTKNNLFYEGNDIWVTIADLQGKYTSISKNKINGDFFPQHWITPKGALLFSFKLSIGQVSFAHKKIYTNEAICSFLPSSKVNLSYFYYSSPIFIVKNAKKNIFNADLLNQDLIANAVTLFPSKDEQKRIADFLDIETTKIDKKIDLFKKKIILLKEYKQSLIYEAVTGKIEIPENFIGDTK